jgi:predicted XRE-type DNA-binding protein
MPSVGAGVNEVRVHAKGEHRVMYGAKFDEAVERTAMSGRVKIERSSRNVFTDLGFPKAEAENLMLRSELMSKIREIARGITQAKAAKRFGITQPRLNDLLRGKIDKFSLDALVNMIAAAGLHVELRVRKVA